MKIQRATFLGVRGVPDLTVDLTDPRTGMPNSLVVVSGPGASGKTRLIEALIAAKEAIGPYGPSTPGAPWIRSGDAAKIEVSFILDESERDFAGTSSHVMEAEVIFVPDRAKTEAHDGLRAVLGRYSHEPSRGKVEYFPAERRLLTFPPFAGLGTGEQRIARVSRDQRKYGFILPFLRALDRDEARRERFSARLTALSPSLRYVSDDSGAVIARCFSSHGGAPVTAAQLSQGEADAVIFAATSAAIGLDHSLVFVDRPDLHMRDLDQLISGLAALGQDNQLFLTGGPDLVAAAGGAHIVSLKKA